MEFSLISWENQIKRSVFVTPLLISLLASFLPSWPPTAQVPVLVAVSGSRSGAAQSGFPTFLRAPLGWSDSRAIEISLHLALL